MNFKSFLLILAVPASIFCGATYDHDRYATYDEWDDLFEQEIADLQDDIDSIPAPDKRTRKRFAEDYKINRPEDRDIDIDIDDIPAPKVKPKPRPKAKPKSQSRSSSRSKPKPKPKTSKPEKESKLDPQPDENREHSERTFPSCSSCKKDKSCSGCCNECKQPKQKAPAEVKATPKKDNDETDLQNNTEEEEIDPCCTRVCTPCSEDHLEPLGKIVKGKNTLINPGAGPRVACGCGIGLIADYILWNSRQDRMGYSYDRVDGNATSNVSEGTVRHPNWQWNHGFKVGMAIASEHDQWEFLGRYTWLQSKANRSSHSNTNSQLYADPNEQPFTTSRGSWVFHLNTADAEVARNFFVSHYLSLRPHVGLKGCWNRSDYNIDLSPISDLEPRTKILNDQKTRGVGVRGGLDTTWHLGRNFSFIGNIAISSMWMSFEVTQTVDRKENLADDPVTLVNVENDFHSLKPILETNLGLMWEYWSCDDRFHMSFTGGWEQQIWIDHNQFFDPFNETRGGNLVMQGFTGRLRLDF